MKTVYIKKAELINVNRNSVTLNLITVDGKNYKDEECDVFATRKVANLLLQTLRMKDYTELNEFFIVNREYQGSSMKWLAVPSIFI